MLDEMYACFNLVLSGLKIYIWSVQQLLYSLIFRVQGSMPMHKLLGLDYGLLEFCNGFHISDFGSACDIGLLELRKKN